MSTYKNVSQAFLQALDRKEGLIAYVYIQTIMGLYAYGTLSPRISHLPEAADVPILDGEIILDGSTILGSSAAVVDRGAYLANYPMEITQSISPDGTDLISGMQSSEISEYTVSVVNQDHHMRDIIAEDNFLDAECWLIVGFPSLAYSEFLEVLRGYIRGYTMTHGMVDFRIWK